MRNIHCVLGDYTGIRCENLGRAGALTQNLLKEIVCCPGFSWDRVNFHKKPGGDTARWLTQTGSSGGSALGVRQ